jgi:hypothetical protein
VKSRSAEPASIRESSADEDANSFGAALPLASAILNGLTLAELEGRIGLRLLVRLPWGGDAVENLERGG